MTEQTLQQLLAERVAAYADSERPKELIDAGIDKLFKDVVDDAFRSYGDFGKAIKAAVAQALPAKVENMFELGRYNALVANALKQRWEAAAVESTLLTQAHKAIDEVLDQSFITGEVSLRMLLDEFIEKHKEEAAENHWEHPEIRFEESDDFLHIYFDPEPEEAFRDTGYSRRSERSQYQLKHALHLRITGKKETGITWHPFNLIGEVYSAKLDDKKIAANMQIYAKWERMLASLYFGNATLVVDCDADDISYGLYD